MSKRLLLLFAFFLPSLCQAGTMMTATGDMIVWPDQIWTLPSFPYSIPIQITPSGTSGTNVAGISATGAGSMSPPGFFNLA
jgi:hypothetical protein